MLQHIAALGHPHLPTIVPLNIDLSCIGARRAAVTVEHGSATTDHPGTEKEETHMYLIRAFGVILMVCGVFALSLLVLDPDSTSGGSTILGVALLVVGAGLFFLPGRWSQDA